MARNGERGSCGSYGGAGTARGGAASVATVAGETTAAGTTVTFFGGQSTFLAKLGACDAVSSFWPIRVSPGTQTSTTMPRRTAARAR